MFISASYLACCGMFYLILCFIGRDRKYDGHPDTWPKEWFD